MSPYLTNILRLSGALFILGYRFSLTHLALLDCFRSQKQRKFDSYVQTVQTKATPIAKESVATQTGSQVLSIFGSGALIFDAIDDQPVLLEPPTDDVSIHDVAAVPPTPSTVDDNVSEKPGPLIRLRYNATDEHHELESDMDALLLTTMQEVLSDQTASSVAVSDEIKPVGLTRADTIVSEVSEWDFDVERYSTKASYAEGVISGGEIYRTLSESSLADFAATYGAAPATRYNLTPALQVHLKNLRPSKQFVSSVSKLVGEISLALATGLSSKEVAVVPYGSIASNLCVDMTPIDLLVIIPPPAFDALFAKHPGAQHSNEVPLGTVMEYELRQSMRRALVRIGKILSSSCGLVTVRVSNVGPKTSMSSGSRMPVLTVSDPISKMAIDISCNNVSPVFSSRLLKAYNGLFPSGELRDFILLTKHWARQRGILTPNCVGGGLSGFAWSLMCVFYCQACLGAIPSLQAICPDRQQWKDPFGSSRRCDVGFVESLEESCSMGGLDGASLFVGFLEFFANYWTWDNLVISVRLGTACATDSPDVFIKKQQHQSNLCIEDPFDIKRDLAAAAGPHLVRIREEFVESSLVISSGGSISSLLCAKSTLSGVGSRNMTTEI